MDGLLGRDRGFRAAILCHTGFFADSSIASLGWHRGSGESQRI